MFLIISIRIIRPPTTSTSDSRLNWNADTYLVALAVFVLFILCIRVPFSKWCWSGIQINLNGWMQITAYITFLYRWTVEKWLALAVSQTKQSYIVDKS